jgi:hypothetical protein
MQTCDGAIPSIDTIHPIDAATGTNITLQGPHTAPAITKL